MAGLQSLASTTSLVLHLFTLLAVGVLLQVLSHWDHVFGKYVNGTIKPIMGHNMPLAAIGVFLLWFGWYGFNGGSVLSADPGGYLWLL